jgi:hypothetical protein
MHVASQQLMPNDYRLNSAGFNYDLSRPPDWTEQRLPDVDILIGMANLFNLDFRDFLQAPRHCCTYAID